MRFVARKALAKIQLASSVKALGDKDEKVRLDAVENLGKLGPAAKPACAKLFQTLTDAPRDYSQAAFEALEKIDKNAYQVAIKFFIDGSSDPRKKVEAVHDIAAMGEEAKPFLTFLKATYEMSYYHTFVSREGPKKNYPHGRAFSDLACLAPHEILLALHKVDKQDKHLAGYVLTVLKLDSAKGKLSEAALTLVADVNADAADKASALSAFSLATTNEMLTVRAIEELAKMEAEAKNAIPALRKLKLSPSPKIREAASLALEKVQK